MLRKLGLGLGLLCMVTAFNTNATETHLLQQGLSLEYELPHNDPQEFINYMFWAIEAKCKIISEDESNELVVEAIAKKGKVNDIPLSAGESLRITVQPNQTLKLNADSGAKVRITNLGEHTVKANCTT